VISIRDWTDDEDEPAAADPSFSSAVAAARTRKLKRKLVTAMDEAACSSRVDEKKGRSMPKAKG
jgi:hypothetical protein